MKISLRLFISYTIQLKINESEKEWNWSGAVEISSVGVISLLLTSKNAERKFIFIEIINKNSLLYITLKETTQGKELYLIQNSVEDITITCFQKNSLNNKFSIESGQIIEFGWTEPVQQNILQVDFTSNLYKNCSKDCSLDKINNQDDITIESKDNPSQNFQVRIKTKASGMTKKLKIYNLTKQQAEKQQKQQEINEKQNKIITELNKNLNLFYQPNEKKQEEEVVSKSDLQAEIQVQAVIFLHSVGISLISNHQKKHEEIMFIYVKNLEFVFQETEKERIIQLKLQHLNVDNTSSYNCQFQTIYTSTDYYNCAINKTKYLINCLISQNKEAKNIILLNQLLFDMQSITIKIESQFLLVMFKLLKSFYEELKTQQEQYQIDETHQNQEEIQLQKGFFWETDEIPNIDPTLYIDAIILQQFEIYLSYLTKVSHDLLEDDQDIKINSLITTLGVALINVDNAPIKLNGIELHNCFDTQQGMANKLYSHFKNQFILQTLNLLGSINILGNPVGLFNNISKGFKDLIDKPKEGFVQGPLEGSIGLAKGAGSLVSHVLSGTFNSVNKIFGSVSSGISQLTYDDEYLEKREELQHQKATTIGEGLKSAGYSIFYGFKQGITGIVMDPITMSKKQGAKGLFKGLYSGATGIIVKPITGILDATSKTAEGIKNSTIAENERSNENWVRYPRVFYGSEKFIKIYSELDANLIFCFQLLKAGKFQNINFLEAIQIFPQEPDNMKNTNCLILSNDMILYMDMTNNKKLWEIELENINSIEKIQGGINIELKINTESLQKKLIVKQKNDSVCLLIPRIKTKNYAFEKLQELLEIQ